LLGTKRLDEITEGDVQEIKVRQASLPAGSFGGRERRHLAASARGGRRR